MAVRKYLLKHYNETTKEDSSIHLQTSSDIVLRPDGSSVEDALSSVKSNMDKLTSDSGDGSIKQAVADGISSIVAGAPESLDTLKEMSDWIQTHENDASAMNSRITKNTNDIAALSEDVADTAATANANNVKITNLQSTVNSATANIDDKLSKSETAVAATKLATSRTIRTNLGSTSTASFNGTANITPGVTGVLPVANGGTGVNNIQTLATNVANNMNDAAIDTIAKQVSVSMGVGGGPEKPELPSTIGSTFQWDLGTVTGDWILVYKDNYIAIICYNSYGSNLMKYNIYNYLPYTQYINAIGVQATDVYNTENMYRTMDMICEKFSIDTGLYFTDYTIRIRNNACFIPTWTELKGYPYFYNGAFTNLMAGFGYGWPLYVALSLNSETGISRFMTATQGNNFGSYGCTDGSSASSVHFRPFVAIRI